MLDPDLDDDLARVVLTHELVHHERGGGVDQRGRPPALATVAQREEAAVEREVARRLVPVDELAELVHEVVANGGGVGAGEVSAYFAVPPDVAALALQGLRASWPGSGYAPAVTEPALSWGNARARWVVGATVGGSAIAFLDATVVNVALPHIGTDLGGNLSALQWVLDAYMVTLTSLLLLGGSLGDLYGRRRVFIIGVLSFGVASLACGAAPNMNALIAFRAVQGAAGALLVPSSLAIISEDFRSEDRSRAIGAWSGLSAVAGAIGPFFGGWLVDTYNWRLVFLINPPLSVIVALIAWRHVPDRPGQEHAPRPDVWGAVTARARPGGAHLRAHPGRRRHRRSRRRRARAGCRRTRRVPRHRDPPGPSAAASRAVPLSPVHWRQPGDPHRLHGSGRHDLPDRGAAADRPRLLGHRRQGRRCCRSRCSCCSSRPAAARSRSGSGPASR